MDVGAQLLMEFAAVELKLTVLLFWIATKFVPVIESELPTAPDEGDNPVMLGFGATVNELPLLQTPYLNAAGRYPEVGAVTICVALQLTTVPEASLPNDTKPLPCVAPNPVPVSAWRAQLKSDRE